MNKPKHSLRGVAVAALALCSTVASVAQAAPTQAELDSIVLYGNTTIAKDSTSAWGVWEQIDPPAAGPQLPRVDVFGKPELYRPLAQATLTSTPTVAADVLCVSGGICGFGVFYESRFAAIMKKAIATEVPTLVSAIDSNDEHPYVFTATPATPPALTKTPVAPVAEQPAALPVAISLPAAVEILGKALDNGSLLRPESGVLVQNGSGYRTPVSTEGPPDYAIWLSFSNNDYFKIADAGAVWYEGYISKYVAGSDGEDGRYVAQELYGVVGYTTSKDDMSALRASNATATYAGYDYKGTTANPNVILNVDFGQGRFTGSFNGGADGKVYPGTSASGTTLDGNVGFNITSGVINGSEFKSTGLSASDGTVSGTVRGAFFGSMAAAAGGVADITKTRTDGAYTNARFVSPFLAIKGLSTSSVRNRYND